jgi:1-deoxy-D-xylulose-5-phosphate reductoisomerase
MKNIVILGSTGSIGKATLDIVRLHPHEYRVIGLSTNVNTGELGRQVREFKVPHATVFDPVKQHEFVQEHGTAVKCGSGLDGLVALAELEHADIVVNALVGAVGVQPTLAAIRRGRRVALANKETLVMAGEIIMAQAQQHGAELLPIDSEHSALHQALRSGTHTEVRRLILTASGGPFRHRDPADFKHITRDEALAHPTWSMGPKITIDSATLMNKGLEVIEAHWLFNIPVERIEVVVHPQSVIHSLVEFIDSSILCQMSSPDMRLPIQYALTYPERWASGYGRLDVATLGGLTFAVPDFNKFPCLKLAFDAIRAGQGLPCVLNAANEMAVRAFLENRVGFNDIAPLVALTMGAYQPMTCRTMEELLIVERWAREYAEGLIKNKN